MSARPTHGNGLPADHTIAVAFRRGTVDLSFVVPAAPFVALTGPNGSGKTTALRCLVGLEPAARLDWGNSTVSRVGYLPQRVMLYPAMSLRDNVASSLKFAGADASVIAERTAELLDLVEIGALARRRPHEVSGGQRQRAGLARAIAATPDLLVLDEPFSAIDVESRSTVRERVFAHVRQAGTRCIMATHDDGDITASDAQVVRLR